MTGQDAARPFRLASPRTAASLATFVLVMLATLIITGALTGDVMVGKARALAGLLVMILVIAAVGLVVARHQPGNAIGWLLLGAAAWFPVTIAGSAYATYAYHPGHRGIAVLAPVALVIGQFFTFTLVVFPLVTLLFPDGHLPSARWRWALRGYLALCAPAVLAATVLTVWDAVSHHVRFLANGSLDSAGYPRGSVGWLNATALLFFGTVAVAWLAALGRQVASWRRSSGERRQQVKWLLTGTVVCAIFGIWALSTSSAIWEVAIIGLAALPVAIGVGILKYRLYEIDRVISRTLAYVLVTGLLIGVYAGLVLLATQVLRFSSPVAVAASTLTAVALFNPLRRRVQRAVDRRFNRARYDADQTVAAFAARLKDAVDLDAVRDDLAGAVHAALEPAHVSVWISGAAR